MFDSVKLLIENRALKSRIGALEKEMSDLVSDMERHLGICTDLATENEDLHDLLKDARAALDFFKIWGESLNLVAGYNPTAESWKPTLDAMARIDAKLQEK